MRLIGCKFDDKSVQSVMKHWPFEVIKDEKGKPKLLVEYKGEKKTLFPEQVVAMILTKLKQIAEVYLGTNVTQAIITVPTNFNHLQRQAVKDSATIAEISPFIINQTIAAVFAYLSDNKGSLQEKVRLKYFIQVVIF